MSKSSGDVAGELALISSEREVSPGSARISHYPSLGALCLLRVLQNGEAIMVTTAVGHSSGRERSTHNRCTRGKRENGEYVFGSNRVKKSTEQMSA